MFDTVKLLPASSVDIDMRALGLQQNFNCLSVYFSYFNVEKFRCSVVS